MKSALSLVIAVLIAASLLPPCVSAGENRSISISSDSFAAIAYSPATGKYGYAYDRRSRAAAEDGAMRDCGADDARIACWINKGFCALALGNEKSCWGVGWTYGNGANSDGARNYALEDCRNRTSGAHIALSLSSDGQYIWDQNEHTIVIDNKGNIYDGRGNRITPTPAPDASVSAHPSVSPDHK